MRHPSELFLKSLLARGKKDDEIMSVLHAYGLPELPEESVGDYLDSLAEEIGDAPADLFDEKSVKWLKEHKIYYLVHPDSVVAACTRLLDNNAIKRDVYVSILGRVSADDLSLHLFDAYG